MVQASMESPPGAEQEQAEQSEMGTTDQNEATGENQTEATVASDANGAQAGEQEQAPPEPQLSVREQFEKDLAEAVANVDEAFKQVQRTDLTREEQHEAVQAYMAAREAEEAINAKKADLDRLERQEQALKNIEKMSASAFKRAGIDPFQYTYHPEEGASIFVPKPTRQRSSGGSTGGNGGEGVSRARSTVRITVDGEEYNPSTFMKKYGDEAGDNPKGAAAWNNDRTHPMFYASAVVRLMKAGHAVVVTPGENPSDKHLKFDSLVEISKMRLGWGPEHETKALEMGCSHAKKMEAPSS